MSNYQARRQFLGRLLRDCSWRSPATHSACGHVLLIQYRRSPLSGSRGILMWQLLWSTCWWRRISAQAQENFRCTFWHNRKWQLCGIQAPISAGVPTKSNYGALGAPHWFAGMSTSSSGLFGTHVKTQLWTKCTDSLAHFLLWLLSNNHSSVFLEILHFAHSQDLCQSAWVTVYLCASRHVHHTRVLNLSSGTEAVSGDALGAFWASLVGGLWRGEKPPDIRYVSQRRVVTPEAGWRSGVTGWQWGHVSVCMCVCGCYYSDRERQSYR